MNRFDLPGMCLSYTHDYAYKIMYYNQVVNTIIMIPYVSADNNSEYSDVGADSIMEGKVKELEGAFALHPHLEVVMRQELASRNGLSEHQVQVSA